MLNSLSTTTILWFDEGIHIHLNFSIFYQDWTQVFIDDTDENLI